MIKINKSYSFSQRLKEDRLENIKHWKNCFLLQILLVVNVFIWFYDKLFHFVRFERLEPNCHTWSPLNLSADTNDRGSQNSTRPNQPSASTNQKRTCRYAMRSFSREVTPNIYNFARWKCFYFKLFHFVRLEVFEPNRHTWSPLNLSANISEWQFVYLLRQFVYRYSKKAGLCRRNIVFLNILFTLYHLFIFTSSIDSTNVLVANLKPLKWALRSP